MTLQNHPLSNSFVNHNLTFNTRSKSNNAKCNNLLCLNSHSFTSCIYFCWESFRFEKKPCLITNVDFTQSSSHCDDVSRSNEISQCASNDYQNKNSNISINQLKSKKYFKLSIKPMVSSPQPFENSANNLQRPENQPHVKLIEYNQNNVRKTISHWLYYGTNLNCPMYEYFSTSSNLKQCHLKGGLCIDLATQQDLLTSGGFQVFKINEKFGYNDLCSDCRHLFFKSYVYASKVCSDLDDLTGPDLINQHQNCKHKCNTVLINVKPFKTNKKFNSIYDKDLSFDTLMPALQSLKVFKIQNNTSLRKKIENGLNQAKPLNQFCKTIPKSNETVESDEESNFFQNLQQSIYCEFQITCDNTSTSLTDDTTLSVVNSDRSIQQLLVNQNNHNSFYRFYFTMVICFLLKFLDKAFSETKDKFESNFQKSTKNHISHMIPTTRAVMTIEKNIELNTYPLSDNYYDPGSILEFSQYNKAYFKPNLSFTPFVNAKNDMGLCQTHYYVDKTSDNSKGNKTLNRANNYKNRHKELGDSFGLIPQIFNDLSITISACNVFVNSHTSFDQKLNADMYVQFHLLHHRKDGPTVLHQVNDLKNATVSDQCKKKLYMLWFRKKYLRITKRDNSKVDEERLPQRSSPKVNPMLIPELVSLVIQHLNTIGPEPEELLPNSPPQLSLRRAMTMYNYKEAIQVWQSGISKDNQQSKHKANQTRTPQAEQINSENPNENIKASLLECLLVNKVWYAETLRILYRHIQFSSKNEWDKFVKCNAYNSDIAKQLPNQPDPHNTTQYLFNSIPRNPYEQHGNHIVNNVAKFHQGSINPKALILHKIPTVTKDELVSAFPANYLSNLECLEIYTCHQLEIPPCFFHGGNLTRVVLPGCFHVTDSTVCQISESSPMLKYLDLRACPQVSDISISMVAQKCPQLELINVGRTSGRSRITGVSVSLLAKHTSVTTLGLAGCDVDDLAIWKLVQYRGLFLERLSLNNCQKISFDSLPPALGYTPQLSVLEVKDVKHFNKMTPDEALQFVCFKKWKECQQGSSPPLIRGNHQFEVALKRAEWNIEMDFAKRIIDDVQEWLLMECNDN